MKSNPHIVIVCPACVGPGSVAGVALRHAVELSKYFWVSLVSDSFPFAELTGIKSLKVTPRRFDYLRRFCHVPNEYSFAKSVGYSLEMIHKDDPIDLIICHGHVVASLSANPLKEKFGIPYALVTHGDIFDRPKGTYDWRLTAFYRAVTPKAYRNADLIFALSPHMASCAIRGGASPEAVKIVPNGIDPEDIGIEGDDIPPGISPKGLDDPLRLLFVGRLSVEKGVEVLVNACQKLNRRGINFILDLIGSGPLDAQLWRAVHQMGLSDQINFLGKVQRRLLGAYYRRANLVCVPSLSEPFGMVIIEALVSGIPVIASNTGGIPSIVKNGKNGLLTQPGNSYAIADVIEDLHKNRKKLLFLSKNAVASVFPRFSWERIGAQMSELIAGIIASRQDTTLKTDTITGSMVL